MTWWTRWRAVSLQDWASTIPPAPPPKTITDLISAWQHSWPIRISNLESNSAALATAFSEGKGLAVADGSYMPLQNSRLGSAGWYLQHIDTRKGCKGVVQTLGDKHEVNAYCSELQGLHSLLMAILAVCTFHNVTDGKVIVCCDNDRALLLSGVASQQVSSKTKHADLVRAIQKLINAILIEVELREVTGHQDRYQAFTDLDRPSQLNVYANAEAKRYLQHLISEYDKHEPSRCPKTIFKGGWSCWLGPTKVTSNPKTSIAEYIYGIDSGNTVRSRRAYQPQLSI